MTFVDVLWSLFHWLKGMSVRMEHATASSASSDAVEIRLQELRSSAVTRGREWLQDALAKISVMELRKNGTCSECWPWTGQQVACGWRAARSIAGCLGTTHAGPVGQNRIVTKVACLSHGAML